MLNCDRVNRASGRSRWLAVLAAASLLVAGACKSDGGTAPATTGSVSVTVTTTGSDLDADGYTVQLDGANAQAVGANGSVSYSSLAPGAYDVTLTGLAANCSVGGSNPVSVTVVAGQAAAAVFAVECVMLSGSLVVTTTTNGVNVDPDGYNVLVDGANSQPVATDGSATFQNVAPGTREVSLEGLAANCSVSGENPRSISVQVNQIATTTYTVTCVPIMTDLEITTLTSGEDLDSNGYTYTIDGVNPQAIGINETVMTTAVAGDRLVRLESVANNCTVAGDNPRTVTVPTSGSATTTFLVTCTSVTGSLVATTTTSGPDQDPDGYTVVVGETIFQAIGVNNTVSINDVPAGDVSAELTGLANNCTVTNGQNPRTVTVPNNSAVQTDFEITCVPITGTVDVTTSTTGVDIDSNGYTVRVDGVPDQAIGVNATLAVTGVIWGDRSVELLNLDSNCSVNGPNPRTVTVPQQAAVATTFDVECTALTGSLMVTANTTGGDLDPDGYMVSVDAGPAEALPTNGSFTFTDVAAGDRSVLVTGLASNCSVTGNNPATVTVPSVGTATYTFDIDCVAVTGSVEATTSTTGASLDPDGYTLNVEGQTPVAIGVNETVTVNGVTAGDRSVELTGVAANCSVTGDNPRTVTVTDGGTVMTTFDVTCLAPLSNKIVFDTGRDGNLNIYVMDSNGANPTQLTSNSARDGEPYVSADGTKIVFTSERDGDREIFVMNADGSGQTAVTSNSAKDAQPTWSPDRTKIAFQSDRDGNPEIYVMDADGSNVVRLTNDAGEDGLPSWSPDGTRIVFYSNRGATGDDIWVMDSVDGGNLQQLTSNAGDDFAPAWSPDGNTIAFTSEQDGNREIYTMNTTGGSQVNRSNNGAADLAPQWSYDSGQIAFSSDRDGNNEVYVMSANGSGQTNISNNPASDFEVSWSP